MHMVAQHWKVSGNFLNSKGVYIIIIFITIIKLLFVTILCYLGYHFNLKRPPPVCLEFLMFSDVSSQLCKGNITKFQL